MLKIEFLFPNEAKLPKEAKKMDFYPHRFTTDMSPGGAYFRLTDAALHSLLGEEHAQPTGKKPHAVQGVFNDAGNQ